MTCLRVPASIPDADAILTCYGGPDWRSLALLGAGFLVVAVMVLAAVVVLALVIAGKRS